MKSDALTQLGRMLIARVRDAEIDDWDRLLHGEISSTHGGEAVDGIDKLDPRCRGIVRSLIPMIVDGTMRRLLLLKQQAEVSSVPPMFDLELPALPDAILAEWISQYSKHQDQGAIPSPEDSTAADGNAIEENVAAGHYDPYGAISISLGEMQVRGWSHRDIVAKQRECFVELAQGNHANTMDEQHRIAKESLIAGNASEAEAEEIAEMSRRNLAAQGVTAPVRIPWASRIHMKQNALGYFGWLLVREARDYAIHDWDAILHGSMTSRLAGDSAERFARLDEEAKALIDSLIPQVVDTTLHYVMMLFQQGDVNGVTMSVTTPDGNTLHNIEQYSDGLAGDLFDWIPAFSDQRQVIYRGDGV